MITVLDCNYYPWRGFTEDEREVCREWLRHQGLDPDHIVAVSVTAEGEVAIICYKLDDQGKPYLNETENGPATHKFKITTTTPPPWLFWPGYHAQNEQHSGS